MEVIGAGCIAFHQKVQEPRKTHAYRPADPAEGDTLAQQLFDLHPLLVGNALVYGVRGKLTATHFTLMILFPMAGMAIFLVPG